MKKIIRTVIGAVAAAAVLGCAGAAWAQVATIVITVDENANGTIVGFLGLQALPAALINDPGPGGLNNVLTYDLLNAPGLVSGDVGLQDGVGGPVLDYLRFNAGEVLPSGNTGALLFYSDNVDGFDAIADTAGPPGVLYTNNIVIPEVGPEGNNRAIYTPVAGQPGFVAGASAPVEYIFISDASAVPEPATWAMMLIGVVGLGGMIRSRRRTATASA